MKKAVTNLFKLANLGERRRAFAVLISISFSLILMPWRTLALDPDKDVTQYNCRTWTRQNGLPVNAINAIAQTKDGYLWLGTSAGLVRFDGNEFKLLDLYSVNDVRNSIVTSLASSHNGGLWVGLENSAFGFCDGQRFSFRGAVNHGGTDMNVRSILESKDGTLWFAAQRNAARLNRSAGYEPVLVSSSSTNRALNVLCGYEDLRGRLWFGTDGDGAYYWQDGKITKLSDPELEATTIFCIAEDPKGTIWIGTGNGLYCYDSRLQRQEIPPLTEEVLALLVDKHGVLWIGTTGHGLMRYQKGTYDSLLKTDGLAGDFVKAIVEDQEGSLWIGTREGVSQISDVKFPLHRATEEKVIADGLAVAPHHDGGVWIASTKGVALFDPKSKNYETLNGLPKPYAKRVFEASNGDLYVVSGSHRLVVFSGSNAVAMYVSENMIVGMAEDEHGVVVSASGELYRAGTNYFLPYEFNNGEKPPFYWILNLASGRDGSIWVACGNGIFRVKDGTYKRWGAEEGLTDTAVGWICEDSDGVVWAGTLSGIARLKDNQIRLLNRKNGLFDDNIYSVIPDDLGNLWVDSGRGIFRMTRQDVNDFADGKTNHVECTVYDGAESVRIADKTTQERVGCKTSDGRIWFPNPRGMVMIDPAHIPTNRFAPPVHIDSIYVNGNKIKRADRIIVPPGRGELEFRYNALTFIAPHKAHFRYRLEGYDKEWVEAGDRRMVFYANLKPGSYTFCVLAANADGVWNQMGDSVRFELQPHFTQTVWFFLLCGGATVAGLFGAYLWRVRRLESKQRELQKNRDLLEAEVRNRTSELAGANQSLQHEIKDHKHTTVELKQRTQTLEKEIEQRKQMQLEIERVHRQLIETSRQAGMAEVASNVLHNVGNVLNSVNVSATLAADITRKFKVANLDKIVALLEEHGTDLPNFLTRNPKGVQVLSYLRRLQQVLAADQELAVTELELLRKNVEHIKEIVTMQQSYAKISGLTEVVKVVDLVEDSLRMNEGALQRHEVELVRDYHEVPPVTVEKHKVLQILVNLLRNAKYACDEGGREDKQVTVRIANGGGSIKISVADNGIGIPAENMTRIFNHGFTTRKTGHGFGLHSGALAAKEMGGALIVHSEGIGHGATFTLELPVQPKASAA